MPKYRVYLETTASLTMEIEVPDSVDPDDAPEHAIEKALADAKKNHAEVCAQDAGWRQPWSLTIGDWDVAREGDGSDVYPELI